MKKAKAAEYTLFDLGVVHIRGLIDEVEKALVKGDVANAAGYACMAAQAAVSLVDDLRFEQGVKAGLARAKRGPRKGKR